MKNKNPISRRSFIKAAGVLPVLSISPLLLSSTLQAAECDANNSQTLVCVFLMGGADSFNFVVPSGSAYEEYLSTRGSMAVSSDDLLASTDTNLGDFGFNSRLSGLHQLYQDNRLAVISNVGNLIRPTSQADFNALRSLPQSLFAHDAQQKLWQTGSGNLADSFGWGGSIAQRVSECNINSNVATSVSVRGSNAWLNNLQQNYISLNPNLDIALMQGFRTGVSTDAALKSLVANSQTQQNLQFQQQVAKAVTRADDTSKSLSQALNDHPLTDMPRAGRLQSQLHLVARMISAREQLSMQKQIFFVGLGGWDTHSNQNERINPLLDELNSGLTSFQSAIDNMGKANSVTTFTASDFGRTLTTNGDGTDHGWGGHSL